MLFWDPILSGQKDVACATCHHPAFGYSDGLDLSIGANGIGLGPARAFAPGHPAQLVKRNSQTVLNVAFNGLTDRRDLGADTAPMFWDLRVRSLEAQALEPIKAFEEMRGGAYPEDRAVSAAVSRVNGIAEYRRLFARAFGGNTPVNEPQPRARARRVRAHARRRKCAVRPLHARRHERAERQQIRGMERFQAIGCINCHSGPMFSDSSAHVLGVPDNPKLPESDGGVNKTYAFRTPSLRNLSATAPYMHNGAFATLPDVINFYRRISRGGGRGGRGGRGPDVNRAGEQRSD